MKPQRFAAATAERLSHYVYALIDSRKANDLSGIFYVGRGQKQRCFKHAEDELKVKGKERLNLKLDTIRELREKTGNPPPVRIVAFGLMLKEAKRLETVLIRLLRHQLHNACEGEEFDKTWLWADEVESLCDAKVQERALPGVTLLVSLNGSSDGELRPWPEIRNNKRVVARRTLGYWWRHEVKEPKRVKWVMGIYGGVVRTVFRVICDSKGNAKFTTHRRRSKTGKSLQRRFQFKGRRMPELESRLRGRRVITTKGKDLTQFHGNGSRLVNVREL